MKNHLFIGLCLLGMFQTSFSQNRKLHLGLEVGVVRGYIESPNQQLNSSFFPGEIQSSLGPRIGVNMRHELKPQLSLKTGVFFTQKGAANLLQPFLFGSTLVLPNEFLKFSFIQLPIMMRFHPLKIKGFYMGMGPYFGLLVSHPHKGFENRPNYVARNTFDLGFVAAIGKEIPVHNDNYLMLEASFELGTNDISRFSDQRITDGSMLARAINFGIAYFFIPQ